MDKKDLLIQLRAAPYGSSSHVLEYRIDPFQDGLEYTEQKSYLWGLIKRNVTKTLSTDWVQPRVFSNNLTMEYHEFLDKFNWGPIWCENKKTLEYYKTQFKTYGDITDYLEKECHKAYDKWNIAHKKYLESRKPIY